jgi:hypothetical protein
MGRRFKHDAGQSLVSAVLEGMALHEQRQRRERVAAAERKRASVEALLTNLAAASLNVVDPDRFAAVSFNRNDYVGRDLSDTAMRQCRDYLEAEGLIEGTAGFQRWDAEGDGRFGRRTRIRATAKLRAVFDQFGIGRRAFTIPVSQLIRIKAAGEGVSTVPPEDVEASRSILERLNQRLASVRLELCADLGTVLTSRYIEDEGEDTDARDRKRRYAGDLTAVSLYRAFKRDWNSGGRIYGGWWMSLPKAIRPHITINGAKVVELDYSALHPRLLFHREGLPLEFDPYLALGFRGQELRDLGKRTLNRLLNRDKPSSSQRLSLRAAAGDPDLLPERITFASYRAALCHQLTDIQHWFGIGEGVRLQRMDSELAIGVLVNLEAESIPVLPIHDSFLVPVQHEHFLRTTMEDVFFNQHGFLPKISVKC